MNRARLNAGRPATEVADKLALMPTAAWPDIPDEQRWALELIEERLERTSQTPDELSARAEELRAQAADTEIRGFRDAALALAERYEEAAAARVASG
ncbi:MAG: hypothetical protein ACRDLO_15240 [Solirubrobacterales bacterium]